MGRVWVGRTDDGEMRGDIADGPPTWTTRSIVKLGPNRRDPLYER